MLSRRSGLNLNHETPAKKMLRLPQRYPPALCQQHTGTLLERQDPSGGADSPSLQLEQNRLRSLHGRDMDTEAQQRQGQALFTAGSRLTSASFASHPQERHGRGRPTSRELETIAPLSI